MAKWQRKDPFGFGFDVLPDGATVTEEALLDNSPDTMDMTRGSLQWGGSRGEYDDWGLYIPGSYKGLGPGPVGKKGSNWPGSAASTRAVFEEALNYPIPHGISHQENPDISEEAWRKADPRGQYNHPKNRLLIKDFLEADEWDY
jgi:hypothetical protein